MPLGIPQCVSVDLFEIVHHIEHQPLAVYLGLASEGETVHTQCAADIGKDRLPFGVEPRQHLDLSFYLFQKYVFSWLRRSFSDKMYSCISKSQRIVYWDVFIFF